MSHTPGPWKVLDRQVWSRLGDHPVAEVVSGKWGDPYQTLRLVGPDGKEAQSGSLDIKAEAYTELIEYGQVDPDEAKANARLIAVAPDMLEVLRKVRDYLVEAKTGDLCVVAAISLCGEVIEKVDGES
ncbi:MAG: hypothetical protein ABFD89_01030 [Bryobacteraceae bacterium]